MDTALRLLAVAALIAANAFFVIAEYGLVTARRSALQQRAGAGSRGARVALRLMDDPVRVISTVQIGITALGILLGAVGEPVIRELVDDWLAPWLSFAIAFLVMTYLSVAFGELVPKALALHAAERVAVVVARPIDLIGRVFTPAVWVLQWSARLVLRPLGVPTVGAGERPVSREELRGMLLDAERHGTLRPDEEDMLTGIIDLRTREARDVMVPWERVVVIDVTAPLPETVERIAAARHSRFPAVDGPGGPVVGVLHLRDLWAAGAQPELRELLRPPVILAPTVAVDGLLRELRRERQHLAVLVSEYGVPTGIATLEDALEEIVGEIEDEFDRPDARVQRIGDGAFLVDAGMSISDFNRVAGAALEAEHAHSVGGAVFDALGRRPEPGDTTVLDDTTLTVDAMDGHRIDRVRVQLGAGREDAPPAGG